MSLNQIDDDDDDDGNCVVHDDDHHDQGNSFTVMTNWIGDKGSGSFQGQKLDRNYSISQIHHLRCNFIKSDKY